jgi:hypothetical protein
VIFYSIIVIRCHIIIISHNIIIIIIIRNYWYTETKSKNISA